MEEVIYLKSTETPGYYKIACDEDTKYWVFNDDPHPVGLTCQPKAWWVRVTQREYEAHGTTE